MIIYLEETSFLTNLSYVLVIVVTLNQQIICFWLVIFFVLFDIFFVIGLAFFSVDPFGISNHFLQRFLLQLVWLSCV